LAAALIASGIGSVGAADGPSEAGAWEVAACEAAVVAAGEVVAPPVQAESAKRSAPPIATALVGSRMSFSSNGRTP
jgi:hypothetical protein